jgi:hypothetical protein
VELPFGLTEMIAQGFRGRRLQLSVGGRPLTGVLRGIELRPGRTLGAALQLSGVRFDAMPVRDVVLRAAEVSIEMPPRVGFAIAGLELAGTVTIDDLVAWADRNSPDWRLERVGDDRIRAIERAGTRRLTAVPSLIGDTMTLQLKRLSWRGYGVDVPPWLPLTHRVEMPVLPAGTSILAAARQGDAIAFRLAIADVGRKIDLRAALG